MQDIFKEGLKDGAYIGILGGLLAMTITALLRNPDEFNNLELILSSLKTITCTTIAGSAGGYTGTAIGYYSDKLAEHTNKLTQRYRQNNLNADVNHLF